MRIAAAVLCVFAALPACAAHVKAKPEIYDSHEEVIALTGFNLHVTCVKPLHPRTPVYLVLYATGDAGWLGTASVIFQHISDQGFYVAAYDAREMVKAAKSAGTPVKIPVVAADVDSLIVRSRAAMGLPESTPVIATGFSRGANFVVFTGGVKSLQHHVAGAVAMALTRETDYLDAGDPAVRPAAVQVDERGRIQTYPAIDLFGSIPIAVIQSNGDSYVPGEEARRLFGPDTSTRHLYQVKASNHGFSGGKDELLRDLDDALTWIEGLGQTGGGARNN